MKYLVLLFTLLVSVVASAQHNHRAREMEPAPLVSGLGDINHPVSTANADAQNFFNQGLAYIYAFNHDEAVRSFTRAAELDPQLAMAYWEFITLQSVSKTISADASFGNNAAPDVLRVAEEMLAGKLALARGDTKMAIELLNKAVAAEDAVSYNEPPDWDLPVRELLGGALLVKGDYAEAEKVFRAEIAKHQRNGRALFGLHESLKKQQKNSSAQMVQREFEKAWEQADTKLRVEDLSGIRSKGGTVSTARPAP